MKKRSFTSLFSSAPKKHSRLLSKLACHLKFLKKKLNGDPPDILPPLAKNQCDYRTATRPGTLLTLESTIEFLGILPKFKKSHFEHSDSACEKL